MQQLQRQLRCSTALMQPPGIQCTQFRRLLRTRAGARAGHQLQQCGRRQAAAAAAVAVAMGLLLPQPPRALAHVSLRQPPGLQQQRQAASLAAATAGFDPDAALASRQAAFSSDSSTATAPPAPRSSTTSTTRQPPAAGEEAQSALQQLAAANASLAHGDYAAALQEYSDLVVQHPALAFTEYARLGRAMCLYQAGRTDDALAALNELELTMRGSPGVHAALAALLYAERPSQRWRAEQQWDIATAFDSRYGDVSYVRREQHWPPRLLDALQRFLALR